MFESIEDMFRDLNERATREDGVSEIESTAVKDARSRAVGIRFGLRGFADALVDIAEAYRLRDWTTLGYESWDAYVHAEFGEERVRLSREQREQMVSALRAASLSTRAIASVLGTDETTVRDDIESSSATDSSSGAGFPAPDRQTVIGRDGKVYPSSRPRPEPQPEPEPEPEPDLATVNMRTGEIVEETEEPEPHLPDENQLLDAIDRRMPGAKADVNKARVRARWSRAMAGVADLSLMDPDEVSASVGESEINVAEGALANAERWFRKLRAARTGLRVVQGGSSE